MIPRIALATALAFAAFGIDKAKAEAGAWRIVLDQSINLPSMPAAALPVGAACDETSSRLEKLPRLLEQARANLAAERVPSIHAETAVKQNPGVLSLVDGLVVPKLGA
jgi:hypothetical protein